MAAAIPREEIFGYSITFLVHLAPIGTALGNVKVCFFFFFWTSCGCMIPLILGCPVASPKDFSVWLCVTVYSLLFIDSDYTVVFIMCVRIAVTGKCPLRLYHILDYLFNFISMFYDILCFVL